MALHKLSRRRSAGGRGPLVDVFVERRGDDQSVVWRRAPGAVQFSREPSAGLAAGGSQALAVSHIVEATGTANGGSTAVAVGEAVV